MSSSAEQFDRVSTAYATSPVHARGIDLRWMIEALAPQPSQRVLDLGTGAGHAAMAVAPDVAQVDAVDISERMLATAADLAAQRARGSIRFHRADVASLPFPAACFDAAISRFSAHHWPDPAAAVREAARVLRTGARLVLVDTVSPDDPAIDSLLNTLELLHDPSHARDARVSEWRRWLHDAGFILAAEREWAVELDTDDWLSRAATAPWRAAACRTLLREARGRSKTALAIDDDGDAFSLPCIVLTAIRL